MIDEVSDTLDWDRKHTIKALNRQVTHGKKAKRRGSKPGYGPAEQSVIVAIWKHSEQPCGMRLKQTLPLWVNSGGEVRVGLERIEEDREEEMERAGETHPQRAAAGAENLVKTTPKNQNQAKCRVS